MGNQTSRLSSSLYSNTAPSIGSNAQELFETSPEEVAFSLKFVPDDFRPEKNPFKLTDTTIINMCMNPELFTNEGDEYHLFKNVLIPALANSHLATQKQVVLVTAMFNFVRERAEFYRSHHTKIGRIHLDPQDKDDTLRPLERPKEVISRDVMINSKIVPQITCATQFILFVKSTVPTPVRFFKKNMECFRMISHDIELLFNKEKSNLEFLYHCFIWAVATGNSNLLVRTGEASFVLAMDEKKQREAKVESYKLDDGFLSTVRADHMFGFAMEKQALSHIDYGEYRTASSQQRSVLAVAWKCLFLIESGVLLTKVSMSKHIPERRKRFTYYRMGPRTSEFPPCIAVSNNMLFVGDEAGTYVYSVSPFEPLKNVSYSKNAPNIVPPVTSDGRYIYSLTKSGIVNVYSIEETGGDVIIKYHDNLKVKLKQGNGDLGSVFPKLLPSEFFAQGTMITNGVVLQILLLLGESNGYQHYVRSFSLIDGQFIGDQLMVYRFPIHSWCYEPISNCIYVLSPHRGGAHILQAEHFGGQSPWLSDYPLYGLLNAQPSELSKLMSLKVLRPSDLTCQVFTILSFILTPFVGMRQVTALCDVEKAEYVASGSLITIEMLCDSLSSFAALGGVVPSESGFTRTWVRDCIRMLIELLKLNIVRCSEQIPSVTTANIIHLLCALVKDTDLHHCLFMFTLECFEKIFARRVKDIADWFSRILGSMDLFQYALLVARIGESNIFPFLFNSQMLQKFYSPKLRHIRRANKINQIELSFLMCCQRSLYSYLEAYFECESEPYECMLEYSVCLAARMVEQMIKLLAGLKEYDNSKFATNNLVVIVRKFLVVIQPVVLYRKFASLIMGYMDNLITSFASTMRRLNLACDSPNAFSEAFIESFETTISCLIALLNGGSELEHTKRYSVLAKTALTKVDRTVMRDDLSKPLAEIVQGRFGDLPTAQSLMSYCYRKVNNPLNRKTSDEGKEREAALLLAVCLHMHCLTDLLTLYRNPAVPVSPLVKTAIQTVYKIRGALRAAKQSAHIAQDSEGGTQMSSYEEYLAAVVNKVKFLLLIPVSDEVVTDAQLSSFLLSRSGLSDFAKMVDSLNVIRENLTMAFSFVTKILDVQDFPDIYYTNLFAGIATSKSVFDTISMLTDLLDDSRNVEDNCIDLIAKSSSFVPTVPASTTVSFMSYMILLLATAKKQSSVIAALGSSISILNSQSVAIDRVEYQACFTFLCYLIRVLKDKNLAAFDEDTMKSLSVTFQCIPVEYACSFSMAHSMLHAGFKIHQPPEVTIPFMLSLSQPEFHPYCLFLYEYILQNGSAIGAIADFMLDVIGHVFTGSQSKILHGAALIEDIGASESVSYCRTPEAQINSCLELIQLLRRVLMSDTPAAQTLSDMFLEILEKEDLDNPETVIRMVAVFNVIADVVSSKRAFSLMRDFSDNKTYFVLSIDERRNQFQGILLPLFSDYSIQNVSFNGVQEPLALVQFHLSMLKDTRPLYKILRNLLSRPTKTYPDCLLSFYAMSCVHLFLSDPDEGDAFAQEFLANVTSLPASNFVFRKTRNIIMLLLKKSLIGETKGIFAESPDKPQFYHASFTRMILTDDYVLNEQYLEAKKGHHIFVTSLLDDEYPLYLALTVTSNTNLYCGVVTHLVDRNRTVCVMYSTPSSQFLVNNDPKGEYTRKDEIIEIKYDPKTHIVAFGSSAENRILFSYEVPPEECSFFVVLEGNTRVPYVVDINPTTECMGQNVCVLRRRNLKSGTPIKRVGHSSFKEKRTKTDDELPTNDMNHTPYFTLKPSFEKQILAGTVKEPVAGNEPISQLVTFVPIKVRESNVSTVTKKPVSFSSQGRPSVWGSPIELPYYYDVSMCDGSFEFVRPEVAEMNKEFYIQPIHFSRFIQLPAEILNCYFSVICEMHRREIITLLTTRVISDTSKQLLETVKFFDLSLETILSYTVRVLVLVEPITFGNLRENRSPIDFDVNVMNKTYVCADASVFDQHSALIRLLSYVQSDPDMCRRFMKLWSQHVSNNLSNPSAHFVTADNPEALTVKNAVLNRPKRYSRTDVLGWLAFPVAFGLRCLPDHLLAGRVFPSSDKMPTTYAYVEGESISLKLPKTAKEPWTLLPILEVSNVTLMDTFFDTVITMKYFVLFMKENLKVLSKEDVVSSKISLMKSVFAAIVSGSPFYYTHDYIVLRFLNTNLPVSILEFTDDYVRSLNMFSLACPTIPHPAICDFIQEQMLMIEDHKSVAYRSFFPEFSDPNDQLPPPTEPFTLPPQTIPDVLRDNDETRSALLSVKRVLTPRTSIINFPFHLILTEWAHAFVQFPQVEFQVESPSVLCLRFLNYVPKSFVLLDREAELVNPDIKVAYNPHFFNSINCDLKSPIQTSGNSVWVKFKVTENITQHNFIVYSPGVDDAVPVVEKYKSHFVSDMREMILQWPKHEDQKILVHFPADDYAKPEVIPKLEPIAYSAIESNIPVHLLCLRSQLLISFNFLCMRFPGVTLNESFAVYKPYISLLLSMKQFKQAIEKKSSDSSQYLQINRRTGVEVRSGVSKRLDTSMIAQFASQYTNPAMFRDLERPFHVNYDGESGIDAGGLAKDFASELVKDIGEPRVGLFILTPNGRNKVGSYKECLVPSPNEHLRHPERMYYALGGLVAIGIRVALTQPYSFPPLFWDYLAGGSITAEHIFEIDEQYSQVIQSLEYALQSGMTADVFENTFNLSSSVVDLRGREIPIGNSKKVTLTNCHRYIAQCHEYRIAELERPMRYIRDGFWDNLDFRIPQYVTAELLEFLACGDRAIDLREMRARTRFVAVPNETVKMFWKVLDRMTNEQRRLLLQFATGTMSIPHGSQIFLTVDFVKGNEDERMPSSSTCFNKLHLPPFSTVDKMYKAFITACEYTGTFEMN